MTLCLIVNEKLSFSCHAPPKSCDTCVSPEQIKKHPFYDDQLSVDDFVARVESVSPESILEIIKEIPDTWLTDILHHFQ